jgi:hypothetical protein
MVRRMALIPAEEVLAHTLATEFLPASNLRGEVAGAAWRYLLPTMEHERVVCLGRPPRATLRTLAAAAREVVLIDPGQRSLPGVRIVPASDAPAWLADELPGSVDLLWVADRWSHRPLTSGDTAALRRLLTASAAIVVESRVDPARIGGPAPMAPVGGDRPWSWLRARPDRGEVRSAVSQEDEDSSAALRERGLAGPAVRLPGPRRFHRLPDRLLGRWRRRWLGIVVPDGTSPPPHPPTYLLELARAADLDLSGWRCALSATGDYNTQKVLLLLTPPDQRRPTVIVKLTRDATVVPRLETERDALRDLEAMGLATDGRIPRVLFAGRHAGLAVVGETVVEGRPFDRASETATRPVEDAAAWLTELGVRSTRPAAAVEVAAAMDELLARFVSLCRPDDALLERLRAAVEAIRGSEAPFPLVFQHGDPGTWNLLVREDGSAVVLDWENADAAGMPLWDLFYLLRSHAVGTGRRSGTRRRMHAIERYLFDASPLSELVVGSVHAYADRLGLERALIEPLFHLCWMHQALKEATRVAPGRVHGAHYNRLLRLGLERRTAPTLQRLFGPAA